MLVHVAMCCRGDATNYDETTSTSPHHVLVKHGNIAEPRQVFDPFKSAMNSKPCLRENLVERVLPASRSHRKQASMELWGIFLSIPSPDQHSLVAM